MEAATKVCQNCKTEFVIEPDDFGFYERMKVPPPTFCPECRLIRRLAWRNERSLYRRICDLCHIEKVMMFQQQNPYKIYCKECWISDAWQGQSYGRSYDFSKPFFKQFKELLAIVPRVGTVQQGNNPGSEYCNRVTDQNHSYLVFGSTRDENCRYCSFVNDSKELIDCIHTHKSERCYQSIDCFQCYDIAFSQECNACTKSMFLYNCRNCDNCFGCVNLRNKQYCLFNEQLSKEEYEQKIKELEPENRMNLEKIRQRFNDFKKDFIVPALVTHHSTDVSGNWIEGSVRVKRSFGCRNVENAAYCMSVFNDKEVMDHSFWGNGSEFIYECSSIGIQSSHVRFSAESWMNLHDIQYSSNCQSSSHLFGCIGLKNAEYCILNKQYTEQEYNDLVAKIQIHMDQMPYIDEKGRVYTYGEFFPIELAPHAYNETLAQEFFPLSKGETIARGYRWRDPEEKNYSISMQVEQIPKSIAEVSDSIFKEILTCAHKSECKQQCTTAFRIIPEELAFYRERGLPLPILCPNCRHYERLAMRNPLRLWSRECRCEVGSARNTATHFHGAEHCPNKFETSYDPERSEVVYCEPCYQAEVN